MRGFGVLQRQRSTTFNHSNMGSCMSSPPDLMPTTATSRSYQSTNTTSTLKSSYTASSASSFKEPHRHDLPRQDSHSPRAKPASLPQSPQALSSHPAPSPSIPSFSNHYDTHHAHAITTSTLPRGTTLTKRPAHHGHRSKPSSSDGNSFKGSVPDFSNRTYGHSVTVWSDNTEVPIISGKSVFNRARAADVADTSYVNVQPQPKPKPIPKGESKFEQRMKQRDIWAQKMIHDEQEASLCER
ncbi:hypothetical protein K461DRAFT_296903 [Myriangium duriaei CBS 260.36]|uniref:Uncharacterized protein n=1 Tax=Myriangium duriaei CBS 260.36 TaxID=1168546 RepID=A0A9P4IVV3_9PEZI|nr:hypothetical protein K461DRAFT_296903 [Myriangium duriaei CBS 260.36]